MDYIFIEQRFEIWTYRTAVASFSRSAFLHDSKVLFIRIEAFPFAQTFNSHVWKKKKKEGKPAQVNESPRQIHARKSQRFKSRASAITDWSIKQGFGGTKASSFRGGRAEWGCRWDFERNQLAQRSFKPPFTFLHMCLRAGHTRWATTRFVNRLGCKATRTYCRFVQDSTNHGTTILDSDINR